MSATLLPIPSGTWTRNGVPVEVLSTWIHGSGYPVALVRSPAGDLEVELVTTLRLAQPDPATTLDGVLADLDALRESTAWAPAGDPVARVHRELGRILEAARAGA